MLLHRPNTHPIRTVRLADVLIAALQIALLTSFGIAEDVVRVDACRVTAHERVTVSAERNGILSLVNFREGDLVSVGVLLAQLKDDAARNALATATRESDNDIDLRYAQKLSELSTLEFTRARQVNQEIPGAKSESEVLRLRLAAERATLQVEQATHQLELARMRKQEAQIAVESYCVRTPISGIVLRVHKRVGEAVHAGDPIAEIANFDRMQIEGFVPAETSWTIQKGDPVRLRVVGLATVPEAQQETFEGAITFVDPVINEVSQQVRIWAEVDNPQGFLRDGLMAEMTIHLAPRAMRQSSPPGFSRFAR